MLIKKVNFPFLNCRVIFSGQDLKWGRNGHILTWNFCYQAVSVRKHLERNRKDKDSKFRLILIESRIHRLSRYYKSVGVLPPTWKYESATASTLVA